MRGTFVRTLVELAGRDPRILLLTGDLGYMALEPFAEKYPKRFFNVGVAEQNMVGLATGLAEGGLIPFVYSIVPFAVLRPYEFIRNGPVQHRLPVRIVGIGAGMDYGTNGLSHYGLEDVAVMRAQPGMTIVSPADYQQAHTALLATWNLPGPVYYRFSKDDKTVVAGLNGQFEVGKLQRLRTGKDLVIVAMGSVATEAVAAADELARLGISSSVVVLASVSPAPLDELEQQLRQVPLAVTVEAHYESGGAGSLLAEVIAERSVPCRLIRCAVKSLPDGKCGSQSYHYQRSGLSCGALVELISRELPRTGA